MIGSDNILEYDTRVSGIIFKLDIDNQENRILTVSEGSLYAFPGGKLDIKGQVKGSLDSFIEENIDFIYDLLEENKGRFEAHQLIELIESSRLKEIINNDEFKNGLMSELYQELGLTTNRESAVHINNINVYTVYFERIYPSKVLLINPTYIVDVSRPENLVKLIDEWIKEGKTEIKNPIWASARDILTPSYHETFQFSVNYIGKKLKEDGLINGRNDLDNKYFELV